MTEPKNAASLECAECSRLPEFLLKCKVGDRELILCDRCYRRLKGGGAKDKVSVMEIWKV